MHQARESIAIFAANAGAGRPVLFVEHDPAWSVEGMVARPFQVVRELLDTRLMRDSRKGKGRAGRRLDGIFASRSVYLIQLLGFRVIRFHLIIGDGPGGRNAVVMA